MGVGLYYLIPKILRKIPLSIFGDLITIIFTSAPPVCCGLSLQEPYPAAEKSDCDRDPPEPPRQEEGDEHRRADAG